MHRSASILAVTLAVTASSAPTACSSASPGVSNGSVSACYRALPRARAAVHEPTARLIGAHRVPADRAAAHLPPATRSKVEQSDTQVCVLAFHGRFAAGQVDLAPPTEAGDYAVVLVTSRRLELVASVVLDHLPRAFGGRVV